MSGLAEKFDLAGKSAFVTGGGTGLGYNMSRALSEAGAKVMIAARRENVLEDAAKNISADTGGEVLFSALDLADRESVSAVAKYATDTMGGVDIFIANAAIDGLEAIDDLSDKVIDDMLEVNLSSTFKLVRSFLPHMRRNKWGRVIFSSSVNSVKGSPEDKTAVYAACKSGLNGFSRVGATELGNQGITFNSLILGLFWTDMVQDAHDQFVAANGEGSSEAFKGAFAATIPVGRPGNTEEIEGLIQLLASDAGSYINGADIRIDGGLDVMIRPRTVG